MDTFGRQHQIRVLFIECVCDDEDLLESNTKVSNGACTMQAWTPSPYD